MFKTSSIYLMNRQATCPIVVNQGGSSSGKTWSLLQLMFTLAMENPGTVTTVVAQDVPNLKRGAYRDAKRIWGDSPTLRRWFGRPNETDRLFTCRNGSLIEFASFGDAQDAKGSRRDFLFINECNAVPYETYRQLHLRTRRQVFLDYNPSLRFWVHDELLGRPGVELVISDHRHNPFLSEEEHRKIEAYYLQDPEFFKVYSRGMTGRLAGLIYPSYTLVDRLPEDYRAEWFGLDFGFTNDPTALVRIRLAGGELWLHEEIYQTGLTNPEIALAARRAGLTSASDIVADSAEPKSIAELRQLGLRAEGALKGPDSVRQGIGTLRKYRLNVTRSSVELRRELDNYRWASRRDLTTGEERHVNQPVDAFNHALDAVRYVALNRLQRPRLSGRGAKGYTT